MNKLYKNASGTTGIINIEDQYYGDTDSVYIREDILKERSPDLGSSDLGGFKNDYGKGSIIENALFGDYKRYWLKVRLENGQIEYKHKFNGLKFKNIEDGNELGEFYNSMIEGNVVSRSTEVWNRNCSEGILVKDHVHEFRTDCKKNIWNLDEECEECEFRNSIARPLDFSYDKRGRKMRYEDWLKPSTGQGINYKIRRRGAPDQNSSYIEYNKILKHSKRDIIVKRKISNVVLYENKILKEINDKFYILNENGCDDKIEVIRDFVNYIFALKESSLIGLRSFVAEIPSILPLMEVFNEASLTRGTSP
jgi:hypothetical protein